MGMFDTIHFDKAFICPVCQENIYSVQIKEFENLLENFYVGDCIGHAEEMRIIKKELFCDKCSKFTGKNVYIIVNRGILIGATETLEDGKKVLNDLNFEKLILWYHDLYQRYTRERKEKHSVEHFLEDLSEWYGERVYEKQESGVAAFRFLLNSAYLKGAADPLESVERFLTYKKMIKALDELREEGHETLEIYYPEEMTPGEEKWSVDVYQDDLNERCRFNWTWTVISRKQLEADDEKEDELPEWNIVVDEPFSDELVCKAVEKWLRGRGYEFGVRMIPFEQAKGSGLIAKLRESKSKRNSE